MPAVVNVRDFELLPLIVPVCHEPSSAVAVWPCASAFAQVTVSPTWIVVDCGANAKPAMSTVWSAASTAGAADERERERDARPPLPADPTTREPPTDDPDHATLLETR